MIILPAIDIKDGNCVRLKKGDFSTVHKVAEDPVKTALHFKECGASWLHTVDLDGAKDGEPKNSDVFFEIAKQSGLKVELGGGIRSIDTVEKYLSGGISRVVLGSAALKNPQLVKAAVKEYGDKIAVGIDCKNGYAASEGWLESSGLYFTELAEAMEKSGVRYVIFTDIARDGMLSGPNLEQLKELKAAVGMNVIASGGINDINDISELCKIGVYGAICGKSIYSGTLDLAEAVELSEKR